MSNFHRQFSYTDRTWQQKNSSSQGSRHVKLPSTSDFFSSLWPKIVCFVFFRRHCLDRNQVLIHKLSSHFNCWSFEDDHEINFLFRVFSVYFIYSFILIFKQRLLPWERSTISFIFHNQNSESIMWLVLFYFYR